MTGARKCRKMLYLFRAEQELSTRCSTDLQVGEAVSGTPSSIYIAAVQ